MHIKEIYTINKEGTKTQIDLALLDTKIISELDRTYQNINLVLFDNDKEWVVEVPLLICNANKTLGLYITDFIKAHPNELVWEDISFTKHNYNELNYLGYEWEAKSVLTGRIKQPYFRELIYDKHYDMLLIANKTHQDGWMLHKSSLGVVNGLLHMIGYDDYQAHIIGGGKSLNLTKTPLTGLLTFDHEVDMSMLTLTPSPSLKNKLSIPIPPDKRDCYPQVILNGKWVNHTVMDNEIILTLDDQWLTDVKGLKDWYHLSDLPDDPLLEDVQLLTNDSIIKVFNHPLNFVIYFNKPYTPKMVDLHHSIVDRRTTLQEPHLPIYKPNGCIQHYYKRFRDTHWEIIPLHN